MERKSKKALDLARWRIFGPNLQIRILHGFNEKGEQELIAKQGQKLTYKYPPHKFGFVVKKREK